MSKADPTHITPELRPPAVTAVTPGLYPALPAGMPSITDLARFARHLEEEAARIDAADPAPWGRDGQSPAACVMAQDWKDKTLSHAWRAHAAIQDLALVLPVRSLREAAVLLTQAADIVVSLAGEIDPAFAGEPRDFREAKVLLSQIDLILVNVTPMVAASGGIDAADIGAHHLVDRRALLFGAIGLEAAP